jgi:hypothetical protein
VDELIKTVSEKAGINTDQAKTAVMSVIDFVKTKAPVVGDQLKGLLSGEGGSSFSDAVDVIRKKVGV